MKIVGVLLVLVGIVILVVGSGLAAYSSFSYQSQLPCEFAEMSDKQFERVKAGNFPKDVDPDNYPAEFERAKRKAALDRIDCDESLKKRRLFTIIGVVFALVGFGGMVGGVVSFMFGRRRGLA